MPVSVRGGSRHDASTLHARDSSPGGAGGRASGTDGADGAGLLLGWGRERCSCAARSGASCSLSAEIRTFEVITSEVRSAE